MKKTTIVVLAVLLAATGLLLAAPALGQMGGPLARGGLEGPMMGGTGGGMMGGGHCPMMGGAASYGPGAGTRDTPVTAAEARTLAERYIAEAGLNVTVTAVKERRAVFEVETVETDGTPGISVFVAKSTGAVWPEMGPQAMGTA